ncbi:hypothetical protein [Niveispirillum cyanobacteriorum]|uniref:Uncharacterized protein n=1 Tax=Niveispirillum cyanobacteriorum TaxID=1612173 RepID=A0A2K9NHC7_9PROT|nr:hypothetical protein [Niveispirillum cyanobacteriorum]AUN31966.1 hypothetical protein C0V82_16180 [Niveispirillum cyanobacteriorum]GGE85379.1 hypothetical protein GCM10011317_48190 [Niveispirillum cyanobacteriorum]
MASVKDGGGSAAPNKIDPLFVTQAARIVVKGMMDWGILPPPVNQGDTSNLAEPIVSVRAQRKDCNGFLIAYDLYTQWGWSRYGLDARAVDMLSRLDAIAEEIQAQHQRQVEMISDAWSETFGKGKTISGAIFVDGPVRFVPASEA